MRSATLLKRLGGLLRSIRVRLVLWFTAILAIVLALFSLFVYINQSRDLDYDALMRLERKMASLQQALPFAVLQNDGQVVIPRGALQDTDIFVIFTSNGQLLASQGSIPADDAVKIALRGVSEDSGHGDSESSYVSWTATVGSARTPYLFVVAPLLEPRGQASFAVLGTPLDPYDISDKLMWTLAGGSLLTLVIALVGGFWLADRAMRPVHTITQAARTISETDLSRRLNIKARDELGELASTFDGMLGRLQTAFERQRQFVADASHELRTPLTIVNLETSRALETRRTPKEYEQALTVIHAENEFMTGLVNDLLMLARMDAGQAAMEWQPLDLSDVAVDTIERLAPLAERSGVTLEAGDLPEARILGDRGYLLQMLSNLVENAIKYSRGESKRVRLETGAADGFAWVRVADTGPGIAPEHLPHLFERFYRVDPARGRPSGSAAEPDPAGGSGLGLSIVQWIARAHGGEVRVESTLGRGTTFEVRFKGISPTDAA
jgi:heavy metal sensor kinase